MSQRKLSISGGPDAYQIRLDDIDIANGIRGMTLQMGRDHLPIATLDLAVWSIEDAELAAVPRIPDATRELLVTLGWTPPAEPALGEPVEIANLPTEVITLIHAVDRMRDQWAESGEIRQHELWQALHDANDKVWNR